MKEEHRAALVQIDGDRKRWMACELQVDCQISNEEATALVDEFFSEAPSPENLASFVGRLDFRPGDKFVVRADRPMSTDMAARLLETFKYFAGEDTGVLLLEKGFDLSILRQEEQSDRSITAPIALGKGKLDTSPAAMLTEMEADAIRPKDLDPAPQTHVLGSDEAAFWRDQDAYYRSRAASPRLSADEKGRLEEIATRCAALADTSAEGSDNA